MLSKRMERVAAASPKEIEQMQIEIKQLLITVLMLQLEFLDVERLGREMRERFSRNVLFGSG